MPAAGCAHTPVTYPPIDRNHTQTPTTPQLPSHTQLTLTLALTGGPPQQSGPSRFDPKSGNQFEPGFGNRGGMGGPGGNQGGPGGMGGGGMGGRGNQPVPLFPQMQGMGGPGPDRGMMDRRREAPQSRDDMEDMKRMRRY